MKGDFELFNDAHINEPGLTFKTQKFEMFLNFLRIFARINTGTIQK